MNRVTKRVRGQLLRTTFRLEALERRTFLDAVLAADINQAPGNNWAPAELASFGNVAYFAANDGPHGIELWRTDGTNAGTKMVKDISPDKGFSRPNGFAQASDGTVYFSAVDSSGFELWKTDGTEAGTVRVKDINPGGASSLPSYLTAFGNKVYFFADDGTHGRELWMSDGTDGGTQLVKDLYAGTSGQSPRGMAAYNGNLFFFASGNNDGAGLWKSSGAVGNATFVTSVSGVYVLQLTAFENRVYFTDTSGELYASTGDVGNKTLVQDYNSTIERFVNANGVLYFVRRGNTGEGLYRINPGSLTPESIGGVSLPTTIGNVGGDVYVASATVATGLELFRVAAGASTVTLAADVVPGKADSTPANLTGVGNRLFFTTGTSATGYYLWTTQGSGATLLKALSPVGENFVPRIPAAVNGRLVILADDPAIGAEFTTSNGSVGGTAVLKDIFPGTSDSGAFIFGQLNDVLVMYATDTAHGTELWSLDANGNATLLKDIGPGKASGFPGSVYIAGNQAFFAANDGSTGSELYVTDGTPGGTHLVQNIYSGSSSSNPANFIAYNGLVYFDATDATHGEEMWVTDGTPGGTSLFRDWTGGSGGFSNSCIVNGILYFVASDAMGKELWRADGTPQGTQRVKDIYVGSDSSPNLLTVYNGMLYFVATDSLGAELWKSDGTDAGTARVKDIRTGGVGASITELKVAGAYLYFNADNGTMGKELWRTDGTATGTIPLGDLRLGSAASAPRSLTAMNDRLYFFITNAASGYDLWQSAGTPETTSIVTNIGPAGVTPPSGMIAALGRLFFSAQTEGTARRVWSSDGTTAGTFGEKGVDPLGFPELYLARFAAFAGQIYVTADDGVAGIEPWRYTDTWAPAVWKQSFDQRSAPAVSLTFNEDVNADFSNLRLTNITTGEEIPSDHIRTFYDSAAHVLRVEFGGTDFIPPDGNYRLTLPGSGVTDMAGNAMVGDITSDFFFLAGDANHDRMVNFSDLVTVAQNYGGNGKTLDQGDFNFDGMVGFADLVVIAQKYGSTLAPPAALAPAVASAALATKPLRSEPAVFRTPTTVVKQAAVVRKQNRAVFAGRRIR